ncbi:MAG: uroporphyrinogen decarboxylase [Pseudomonadota bacterium]|nr:uroporphyrinogen decarboxylase [Pseudomonadota bacterium]
MEKDSDHILIKAIKQKPIERTPIWIMRQAGRYLPEYKETKNEAGGFIKLIRNPELACEVTLQPLRRFSFDAAILFSDILTISDLLRMELKFIENKGPVFDHPLSTQKDLDRIGKPDEIDKLHYVFETIKLIKKKLNNEIPLIGFIGSPWTVATYLVEGNSSKKFNKVLRILKDDKVFIERLLDQITEISINYLQRQVHCGVDVAMIFDTWGGLLEKDEYEKFSLKYIKRIKKSLDLKKIPLIYYSRGLKDKLENLGTLDVDVLGIDANLNPQIIKKKFGNKFSIQGNLDTEILKKDETEIVEGVEKVLSSFGHGSGHIFNLGSGITPDIDPEKVKLLVDILRDISPKYHIK